jgi:hypothetical protein
MKRGGGEEYIDINIKKKVKNDLVGGTHKCKIQKN